MHDRVDDWRRTRPIDVFARLFDRLSSVRVLRRIRSARLVNRLADAVYHAQLVQESVRFAARELSGSSAAGVYRPRGKQLLTKIRHRSADTFVLNEIVRHRCYDRPPEAQRQLRGLGRPPRVVDAGANIGLFGIDILEEFPDATITAFEPDPANAAILEDVIRLNGLASRWRVVQKCAGTDDGIVMFRAHGHVGSRVESSSDAKPMSAADVFPYLQDADLLKMDIEGSEWPILSDERLGNLRALVVVLEFHQYSCPYPDANEAVLNLLSRAGFTARRVDVPQQPAETGIVWAWK